MAGALVIAIATGSGAAGVPSPSAASRTQGADARVFAPEKCPTARKAVRFYQRRYEEHRMKMGAGELRSDGRTRLSAACPRYLASVWQRKARAARKAYERWHAYHWQWKLWLPSKWVRIAICETGLNWRHSNSSYEGSFGFAKSSWDGFKYQADRRAGPYPEDAWQATPRQQYEVALAIWRRYGFSGWGCRGA